MTTARVTENFSVTTLPGSKVFTARTPTTLKLSKNGTWTVYVAKHGFETEAFTVDKTIDHIYWMNLLNLGLGALVDWGTGAYQKAATTEYHFELEKMER